MTRVALLALLFAFACQPTTAPAPATPPPGGVIALVGGRSLEMGDRVARLLNEMADLSGVVGGSRFQVIPGHEALSGELLTSLAERTDLRAVVALVGNLSLLSRVDPNQAFPEPGQGVSRRELDLEALDSQLLALEQLAHRAGFQLVVATAPLGKQGRVEVPELLTVAAHLRARGPVLDLSASFRELESATLFENGIDRLDRFGQEELARQLFRAVIQDPGPIPPQQAAESIARAERRAFAAWLSGDMTAFHAEVGAALETPASNPGQAVRQAALVMARDGASPATWERWREIQPGAEMGSLPGLAVAQFISGTNAPGITLPEDDFERELAVITLNAVRNPAHARRRAALLTQAWPHRPEAWIALLYLRAVAGLDTELDARNAYESLSAVTNLPVTAERLNAVLDNPVTSLGAVPPLLVALRPYASMAPSGPLLDEARRLARCGDLTKAITPLDDALRTAVALPPSWRQELERLKALRDG